MKDSVTYELMKVYSVFDGDYATNNLRTVFEDDIRCVVERVTDDIDFAILSGDDDYTDMIY